MNERLFETIAKYHVVSENNLNSNIIRIVYLYVIANHSALDKDKERKNVPGENTLLE